MSAVGGQGDRCLTRHGLAELVQVYADSSRMWATYPSMRDGYREGAERAAAAAAARLDECAVRLPVPRSPMRLEPVASGSSGWPQTIERVLARWRAGHLGPMADSD